MKRIGPLLCALLILLGCSHLSDSMEAALSLRDRLLGASGCSFSALVTADHGSEVHSFTLDIATDASGDSTFSVTAPESIEGITGRVGEGGSALTFDDKLLAFPMLADGQLSPVVSPWIVMRALRSGYISSAGKDGDGHRITLSDSYEDDALMVDVWIDEREIPVQAEILYEGVKILTLRFENFVIL